MRLLPMKEPDRSWRSIKGQWKKDAESVGEDFSTFSTGSFSAYDALTKDGDNPNLYCLSDGERVHAACQVSRLMMSKFPNPILRARFIVVSPVYELGIANAGQYAQMMVALFSGIVWLSRDTHDRQPHPLLPEEPRGFAILRGAAGRDRAVAVLGIHDRRRLDRMQPQGSGTGGSRNRLTPLLL